LTNAVSKDPILSEEQSEPARIERPSLHGEILARLRTMIVEGDLAPGARINEALIVAQFGVSRTPLREAIKSLASEGLVELLPRRGAVVRSFTAKEVRDTIEVIRTLEEFAAATACISATDEEIAGIRDLHNQMEAAYRKRERRHYYALNQEIHTRIVALSNNPTLAQVHGTLQARMKRFRFAGHAGAENWAKAMEEHVGMIEALDARDSVRLSKIIGKHMNAAWERIEDLFDEEGQGARLEK